MLNTEDTEVRAAIDCSAAEMFKLLEHYCAVDGLLTYVGMTPMRNAISRTVHLGRSAVGAVRWGNEPGERERLLSAVVELGLVSVTLRCRIAEQYTPIRQFEVRSQEGMVIVARVPAAQVRWNITHDPETGELLPRELGTVFPSD